MAQQDNNNPGRMRMQRRWVILTGAAIVALIVAAILLLTIGPFSSAMPWGARHVNIQIGDVAQVTLDRPLAHHNFPIVDTNAAGTPDVVALIAALQGAKGLGHAQDDVGKGGYPDTLTVTRNDGSSLTVAPAPVCLQGNDQGDCSQFSYATNDFQVYDSRAGGNGEVYHSPELGAWFKDVFARYY